MICVSLFAQVSVLKAVTNHSVQRTFLAHRAAQSVWAPGNYNAESLRLS